MTMFDRRLADALDDLASPQFPDYFDDVLAKAVARRQRPAWTFPGRWIPMSILTRGSVLVPPLPWRTIGIVLMLLALLVAGAVISIGLNPDRNPAPPFGPARNGLIAYVSGGDVFSRDLETGAESLLVGGSETDVYPIFSRDGLSLAFFRLEPRETDGATVMVANADGTNVRPVLGPALIDSATWSPSSDELAVISRAAGERTKSLSVVPIGRGEEARVLEVPVAPEGQVDWRPPDGREVIFHAIDFSAVGGPDYAIYAVRPDGSGFRQVSQAGTVNSYWSPWDFTPDGSRMFFTDGDKSVGIHILDLGTGEQRPFGAALPPPPDWNGGPQHHGHPTIAPDGATMLFGRYWNDDGTMLNHQLYVATIDSDGADAVAVGPVHRSQGGRDPFWQAISPDGDTLLVVETDTFDAWIVRPDGSSRESLDWGQLNDPPTWQRIAP